MAYTPMDYLSQYTQPIMNDINTFGQLASGDENAWTNQMGFETEEERKKRLRREAQARGETLPEDTLVTSTKTDVYADGSQTETVKTETPAPVAPTPEPAAQPEPQAAPAQMSMAERAHQQQMAPQAQAAPAPAAPAPTGPVAPEPQATAAPAPVSAAPVAPSQPQAGAPVPAMPALPTPGPGVQVAGPTQMPPQVGPAVVPTAPPPPAQPPAVSAAPAQPAWVAAANEAGNDFNKLLDVMAAHPESRSAMQAKLKTLAENQRKKDEADALIEAAKNGDPKAMNKLEQAMRPTKGREREEITAMDYVKAYIYTELGLTGLAQAQQAKILGKDTKFGQVQLGGTNWSVETDAATGEIIRAKDDEGNIATKNTLNKLNAGGMKAGTHAYGFTGGSMTIPAGQGDAGQEYRQRTNAITGAIENVITTGPNAGKIYSGPPGLEKRVETSTEIKLRDAFIEYQTKPTIAMATSMLELAGKVDNGKNNAINNAMAEIQRRSPDIFKKIAPMAPEITGRLDVSTPAEAKSTTTRAAVTGAGTGVTTTPPPPAAITGGATGVGGGSLLQAQRGQESNINISEADIKDRNKSNREYSDQLASARQTGVGQNATIARLQTSIDRNPEFWGIDTNSPAWRAFVDVNSTNENRAEALNTFARNLNIPKEKRAAFDATMNDYRNLQVNAITGSGLTASQTNTERESQRVMGTVGAISDRPAAAKAALEYAKAKIEYTDAKSRAWQQARKNNPGIDRLDFEANFDATQGEQIFQRANERMANILGGAGAAAPGAAAGPASGTTKTIGGRTYIYDGRGWKPI